MDVGPSLLPAFPLQTVVCFKLLQNKIFLVSFIIKVTVSAPCEPGMSCLSCRFTSIFSHVYAKLLFDK